MTKNRKEIYKRYRAKKKKEKIEHEISNGVELGLGAIRVSDFVKEKILSGKTQVLIIDNKIVQFHKDCVTGYWVNNTLHIRLNREKLRLHLGLTKEQMKGYDSHHIDENKDNNDISNLQLVKRKEHATAHALKQIHIKIKKTCEYCGEEYEASSNVAHKQRFCNQKCQMRYRRANGLNNAERICLNCGKKFIYDKSNPNTKFCSKRCAGKYNYYNKRCETI